MAGSATAPITYSDKARVVQPMDWNAAWVWMKALYEGRHLSMRPAFVAGRIAGTAKPTPVKVGAWAGYSMPIYNNDDEELSWRLHVPGRWNGMSDIMYYLVVALADAEDAGDEFKFLLSWANTDSVTSTISTLTISTTVAVTCSTSHLAQYSVFKLGFTIDYDGYTPTIATGTLLAGNVQRVAGAGTAVSNEIIVIDHWLTFTVDKIFKA